MDDGPGRRDGPSAGGLLRGATRMRLTEDLVSLKVRFLRGGRPASGDLASLARVHRQALETIASAQSQTRPLAPASAERGIGLGSGGVELAPYDAGWPLLFNAEAERIRSRLGPLATAVHHVGSTSIPGMPAKPLIDMAVAVDPAALPERLPEFVSAMEGVGYRYCGDFGHHGGYYFSKQEGIRQTFTTQFHASDSWDLARLLRFRDEARSDPGLFREYAAVKVALASALGGNRGLYFWYKAHWLNDRLLEERGPAAWGTWFLLAQYPTMIEVGMRIALGRLRPRSAGPGMHPLAIRGRRSVGA
jgi:GrpB-like predicted nucleotidyltransferase (UPF0157 family)